MASTNPLQRLRSTASGLHRPGMELIKRGAQHITDLASSSRTHALAAATTGLAAVGAVMAHQSNPALATAAFFGAAGAAGYLANRRRSVHHQEAIVVHQPPPLSQLSENDFHQLSLFAQMAPELMPSLTEVTARITPEEQDVLKRYHTAYTALQPIDAELADEAQRIFSPLIPREGHGGYIPYLLGGRYQEQPIATDLTLPPTQEQALRAQALGLPLITGGKLCVHGTRNSTGYLPSQFHGYHRFISDTGEQYYSLQPLDDATPEEIVDLYRFIAQRTLAQGVMAQPVGIHFYRGEPRILFEILHGYRMFCVRNTDPNLPPNFEEQFDAVMSEHLLTHKRIYGRFGDDDALEEDYMIISEEKFRIGLQVRVGEFIESVKKGRVFRLI